MFNQINNKTYNTLVVGLDYDYAAYCVYKQIMYQAIMRGKELGCTTIDLGYTAEMSKKILGAKKEPVRAYVQAADHYNYQILDSL